jgi:hypothetical protein
MIQSEDSPTRKARRLEIRDWRLEIRDWRLEIGGWRLEVTDGWVKSQDRAKRAIGRRRARLPKFSMEAIDRVRPAVRL